MEAAQRRWQQLACRPCGIVVGGSVGQRGGDRAKGEGVAKLEPSDCHWMPSSLPEMRKNRKNKISIFFANKNVHFVTSVLVGLVPEKANNFFKHNHFNDPDFKASTKAMEMLSERDKQGLGSSKPLLKSGVFGILKFGQ